MGKKSGKKASVPRVDKEEREQEEEEDELERERMAVEQIIRERQQQQNQDEEDAEGDDDDDVAEPAAASRPTYNREALLRCLQDWETIQLPFLETMEVAGNDFNVEDEMDDIQREMAFYEHAMLAVTEGQRTLKDLGVPTTRPSDFFCEQVKSDAHMARVKDRMLVEQKRIDAFEQRKNREQNRKFNKQVAETKRIDKRRDEEDMLQAIDDVKRKKSGDREADLERILNNDGEKSLKRKNMDKKYGFGGRDRKRAKLNDSKSLNSFKEFNPRGGKFNRLNRSKGGAGKGGKKAKSGNRPGKDARRAARSSRSS